jgi:hypothetical protein
VDVSIQNVVTVYFQERERSNDAEGNAILGELHALALYVYVQVPDGWSAKRK